MSKMVPPVVILSTADFHSDVWTNKQHLAVGLAQHTPVTYLESFGLRAPRPRRSDIQRIARRLQRRNGAGGTKSVPNGVDVVRPLVVPFHGNDVVRVINRRLVDALPLAGLSESVLWTFSPLTYGLERRAKAVVYHSVDLLHTQPGVPAEALLRAEKELLTRADRVVASSNGVREHLQGLGCSDVALWENVADTQLFRSVRNARVARAVFAGNLTPNKVDSELLLQVAEAGIDTVIAGPMGIDGSTMGAAMRDVLQHPRVTYLGTVSPARLADEFSRSMVGIIPYRINAYTEGVFPLKVYEYLSAGLHVVSTRLHSLNGLDEPGLTMPEPVNFAVAVSRAIDAFNPKAAEARSEAASRHSWGMRTQQALDVLSGLRES